MSEVETLKKMTPEDVSKLLQALTPEQLGQIRAKALAAGLSAGSSKLARLSGSRMQITLILPPEVTEPLYTWSAAAQCTTPEQEYEFFEPMLINWITSGIYSDYGGEAPAAPVKVPASGIPAGEPAAATAK